MCAWGRLCNMRVDGVRYPRLWVVSVGVVQRTSYVPLTKVKDVCGAALIAVTGAAPERMFRRIYAIEVVRAANVAALRWPRSICFGGFTSSRPA